MNTATDLLTLHALRLGGVLDDAAIAARIAADQGVVTELLLESASRDLAGIVADLSAALPRFAGYSERFTAALVRARDPEA